MVELFEKDLMDDGRRSSKGNQLKWEAGGIWYKADYIGYEGLAECVVSGLLKRSSLAENEYVTYEYENIKYKNTVFNGCKSYDFKNGWQVITLERLFMNLFGKGLNAGIYSIAYHTERVRFLVEQVENVTGIKGFGTYISKMFAIDAIFLNEDRHTHNISVLWDGAREYRLCPFYDHGGALLSDTTLDYPLGCNVYDESAKVKAKTVCSSFEEQLDIAEKLYGSNISFSWNEKDVDEVLSGIGGYAPEVKNRVKDLLLWQRRRYSYLFD